MPQIIELMKSVNRFIRFEVATRVSPFGTPGGTAQKNKGYDDDGYQEMTEDDFNLLSKLFDRF